MREHGGNKLEEKRPYTRPTLTVEGKASEFTPAAETNAKNGGSAKKSYTKPALTIYGTIKDLTKTVGQTGPADGGTISFMTQSHL
jgi:hypothetical protein